MRRGIFIFSSERNVRLFAFTRDGTGANLPYHLGPWRVSDGHSMQLTACDTVDPDPVRLGIEGRGFYLSRPDGIAW